MTTNFNFNFIVGEVPLSGNCKPDVLTKWFSNPNTRQVGNGSSRKYIVRQERLVFTESTFKPLRYIFYFDYVFPSLSANGGLGISVKWTDTTKTAKLEK